MKAIEIFDEKLKDARENRIPDNDPKVIALSQKRTETIQAMHVALKTKSEDVRMAQDAFQCLTCRPIDCIL